MKNCTGTIIGVNGNMITVAFTGAVAQNEVGHAEIAGATGTLRLMAEVVRVRGRKADMQVFEDTRDLAVGNPVTFTGNLLAVELVRNGHIGRLHTIRTGTPREHGTVGSPPPMPLPAELDYDAWLGPAPAVPYTMERVHAPRQLAARPGWMRVRDYCDGMILNWGTHLNDIAQWGNNTDRTGPVEVEARGKYPDDGGLWDVLIDFEAEYRYANGVKLVYKMDHAFIRFEGDEGWIEVDKGLKAHPRTILSGQIGTEEITFPLKTEKRDFLDAIKTRGTTLEDAEVGHRTASVCHLAHISIQLGGRKLRWDPDREVFPDDPLANRLLHRPAFRTTDSRNISGT